MCNISPYFCVSQRNNIWVPWFQAKRWSKNKLLEWMRQKFPQKLLKIANIPIWSVIIQILFNISTYFCVSQRKHIWVPWFQAKRWPWDQRLEWMRQKLAWKWLIYNQIILKLFNWSICILLYFFCFGFLLSWGFL